MFTGITAQSIWDLLRNIASFFASFRQIPQHLMDAAKVFATMLISTPDMYTFGIQGVQDLWGMFRLVANLLLILVAVIGGLQIMIGRATDITYLPPENLVGRLVAGALSINASFFICQTVVGLENLLCGYVIEYAQKGAIPTLLQAFHQSTQGDAGGSLAGALVGVLAFTAALGVADIVVIGLVIAFVLIMFWVLFQAIERIALLNLLIVLSPLAMLAWILPQTERWAEFWTNLFVTTVFVQFFQVVALVLGILIMSTAVKTNNSVVLVTLACGVLITTATIPRILSRMGAATGTGGLGKAVSSIIRFH